MRSAAVAMVVVSLFLAAWSPARAEDTDAIATLTQDQARRLVHRERRPLSFDSLTTLSPAVAQELATHVGRMISFDRLQTLSPEAAKALTNHKGSLYLTAVRELEDDAVAALLRHEGTIMLDGDVKASEKARWALENSSTIDLNHGF